MKVYITTCKDGYGGYCVDRVFDSKSKAVDFIMARHYPNELYKENPRDIVEKFCEQAICEYEVE